MGNFLEQRTPTQNAKHRGFLDRVAVYLRHDFCRRKLDFRYYVPLYWERKPQYLCSIPTSLAGNGRVGYEFQYCRLDHDLALLDYLGPPLVSCYFANSTFSGSACGGIAFLFNLRDTAIIGRSPSEVDWTVVYLSCSLGTTLLCTTLITYRIVTAKKGTNDCTNTNTYRRVIEILVESASLYAIGLIGYMVLITLNVITSFFAQTLFVSITAISPTLIVARVASGNARPDDSWQTSNNASSLRFGSAAHSTSVDADSELTTNGEDVDMEQGGFEAIDNRGPEHVVNTGQGLENRGKEAASKN
ncbi:hypothetical protein EDD85DRAFT_506588 [Armillaria nabsnona]|nr:hypothetical protein EDD85DRAFT_506588 [Armillaria nabsnona]